MFVFFRIFGVFLRGVKLYNNYEDMIKIEYFMLLDNFFFLCLRIMGMVVKDWVDKEIFLKVNLE